jgi:hypothetical protein
LAAIEPDAVRRQPSHRHQVGSPRHVDLSGVSVLVTFGMRSWSKICVSDTVTDAQMAAVEQLLPIAFAGFQRGMLSFTGARSPWDSAPTA